MNEIVFYINRKEQNKLERWLDATHSKEGLRGHAAASVTPSSWGLSILYNFPECTS